ncbi:MAG: ABC transporter ATP-binding protein [Lachnospiraceae bacterium]
MKKRSTILRIGQYLMKYKWYLICALFLSIMTNLLALVGPMLSGYAIDAIELGTGKVDLDLVIYYCKWMVIIYAASSILAYGLSLVMLHITKKVVSNMRKDVFDHLMELPVSFFDTNASGDIISKISYDIDTVNTSLSSDLVQILASVITVFGSLIMMLIISPKLVLIFVVTVPMAMFFTKKLADVTRPLFRKRSKKLGELNGFIEEMMTGQKTLKAYDQQEEAIKKFSIKNIEAVDAYYDADYMGSMVGPTVNLISNISLSFVTVFGAILYLFGKMSLGNISSFVLYSRKFSGPINEAANIMSEFQSSIAAAERVFRLMDERPEKPDGEGAEVLTEVNGDVALKHIDFGYTKEHKIIHDLSLSAPKGKLIAIGGPTGAGKTTLINLLMRFYDVDNGAITVDNKNIEALTRNSLRKAYAMVLQDTWLFYGTMKENIAYGNDQATMDDIIRVAKAAKIHSYIAKLPEGYDTILSDDGTNISKGQKQLITIARAMLLDAKMLILDEATSNVDTRTELQIQQAMRKLMENKTCFVIAHRLSTIRNADMILVVKDGAVVEMGDHKALMRQKGFYSQLYYSQFQ